MHLFLKFPYRFTNYHRKAIQYPLSQFEFVGVDPGDVEEDHTLQTNQQQQERIGGRRRVTAKQAYSYNKGKIDGTTLEQERTRDKKKKTKK